MKMNHLQTSFFLLVTFLMTTVFAADAIGTVIAVEGKAEANTRSLARGGSIFITDLIKVAANSKVQIRFTDGGILNLIALTEYRIDSYQFNQTGTDNYSANLVKGGFRALSGSIGKENPDGVKVKTPVATIGIRGTIYQANMQNGQVFFGCDSGSISISNSAGERTLEQGQFVSAASFNQLGDITTVRPDALSPQIFTPAIGGQSLEAAEAGIRGPAAGEINIEVRRDEGNPPC